MMVILLIVNNPKCNALVLRKVGATLRDSVYSQLIWAIEELGLINYFKCGVSPLEITYIKTGQKIYFRGADTPVKIKSIKPKMGYIGITFFEELDQFFGMEEIRNILQSANRGGETYWNFFCYNPPKSANCWVNEEALEEVENRLVHHSTYLDVPRKWLGGLFFEEAEFLRIRKPKLYRNEYLGEATGTGGSIFENVEEREITEDELKTMGEFYHGLDWGWTHAQVFVQCSYDRKKDILYITDEVYLRKCKQVQFAKKIAKFRKVEIIADSAEPERVAQYRDYGFDIIGASKGWGSRTFAWEWLQQLVKIVIDPNRCPNIAKELRTLEFEQFADGSFSSQYPNVGEDGIFSIAYALNRVMREERQYDEYLNVEDFEEVDEDE